jgi:hypothetical protein
MRRIVWGVVVAWVAGCGYPSFEFETGKTTTKKTTTHVDVGAGGHGGAGGAASTVTVSCLSPASACDPGEVCCFHETSPVCDHCSVAGDCAQGIPDAGSCSNDYYRLECEKKADCPVQQICCGLLEVTKEGGIRGSSCQLASKCIAPNQYILCRDGSECGGKACTKIGYGEYSYCTK